MIDIFLHTEILRKFDHLKGSVLIGRECIKGKGKDKRVPADEYVSAEHILHDLIRGFYKPKGAPFLLSYQATESEENYGRQIIWKDKSLLEFEKIEMIPPSGVKDNRKTSDIAAARYNLKNQIPIGILHKVKKGVNVILGLGIIIREDTNGKFIVLPYCFEKPKGEDLNTLETAFNMETQQNLTTEVAREIKQRKGQSKFKQDLLTKYSTCAICDISSKYTIASHIKPWSICTNYERLNVNNGLLLCPNHDYLFDKGWISFNKKGELILSNKMNKNEFEKFKIDLNSKIDVNATMEEFILYHNTYVLKK